MAEPEAVEVTVRIAAPPEAVFRFLVDPDKYVLWQGIRAALEPVPGGAYVVEVRAGQIARGTYVEVDPPRRLVFTWGWDGNAAVPPGSSTVAITLEADGNETLVRLRHHDLPDDSAAEIHREGWTLYLERLTSVAGRG